MSPGVDAARVLRVPVPEGLIAGSPLNIPIDGGEKLVVAAPAEARAGDTFVLQEATDGSWSCHLERSEWTGDDTKGEPIEICIPAGVVPGETQLRVKVTAEKAILIPVPPDATPGRDRLLISQDSQGVWQAGLVAASSSTAARDAAKAPRDEGWSCEGRQICMTTLQVGDAAHQQAIEMAIAAGASVNKKIAMGTAPPLFIPGLLAKEVLEEGEVLYKISSDLHISEVTCELHMRELFQAVEACDEIVAGRRREQAHAVCVAVLLGEVRLLVNGSDSSAPEAQPIWLSRVPAVWGAAATVMMGVPFDFHPQWRWIAERAKLETLLKPSAELDHIETMVGDLMSMYAAIRRSISPALLGPGFDAGMYMKARLCMLTRQFGTPLNGASLVPVVDLFNHSHEASVATEWDVAEKALVFKATRRHEIGEELFISYGTEKSNALLFRAYGFTLPSEVETVWSCSCSTSDLQETLQRLATSASSSTEERARWLKASEALETRVSSLVELNFHSQHMLDLAKTAMEAVSGAGADVAEAFRELFAQKREALQGDPALQQHIAALEAVRMEDATSAEFWRRLDAAEAAERSADEEEALRVKIGEYLCLTAHIEALDACAGRLASGHCLRRAEKLRQEMASALDLLQAGQPLPRTGML